MRDIFVIADTHFGHANVLKFERNGVRLRPEFNTIKEHDEYICDNWNTVVKDGDIVYVLGDVYFSDASALKRLKGRKRLVLGNHDNPRDKNFEGVFGKIMAWRMFPEYDCVLTHIPIHLSEKGYNKYNYNVHGHIHDLPAPTCRHICVSVEQTNYSPVKLQELSDIWRNHERHNT